MSIHLSVRRTTATTLSSTTFICNQCRHATLLRRPKRPYTFTQLVTLSDGSTFTHRTTSPISLYRSTRDTRSAPMWNPSSEKLLNVEEDEGGRLAAFRSRFGRGWDATNTPSTTEAAPADAEDVKAEQSQAEYEDEEEENLMDLISSFGQGESGGNKKGGKKGGKK